MTIRQTVLYVMMVIVGGLLAYDAAPDIETIFFPVLTKVYQVSNPDDPAQLTQRHGSVVCWFQHLHKARNVEIVRRSIAILLPDGSRTFGDALDGRTEQPFNNRDAKPLGFDGVMRSCTQIPEDIASSTPLKIEIFSQYSPTHHLWLLDQTFPTIDIPPEKEGVR